MAARRKPKTDDRPLILAVDTSTLTLSVALTRGTDPVGETTLHLPRGHSRALLDTLVRLLDASSATMADVAAFCIGVGHGSFTGLRIGMALMKGLALSFERPLYSGSSLAAAAWPHLQTFGGPVSVCVDARKGEIYTGTWIADGPTPRALTDELVIPPRQLAEELLLAAPGDAPILFMGTGAAVYQALLGSEFGPRARFADPALGHPRALYLARSTATALAEGRPAPDLATLEPRYIRPSEAELGAQP